MKQIKYVVSAALAFSCWTASASEPVRIRITEMAYQQLNCRQNYEPGPSDGVWGSTCDDWDIYRANGVGRLLVKNDGTMYIRNSAGRGINYYDLGHGDAVEYRFLFSRASKDCPVHVEINRETLRIESVRPTCDPVE